MLIFCKIINVMVNYYVFIKLFDFNTWWIINDGQCFIYARKLRTTDEEAT